MTAARGWMLGAAALCALSAAGVAWRHVGAGMGGNSYWLAFDPNNDDVMFYAPDVGGCYRTDDAGRHWKKIDTDFSRTHRAHTWTLVTVAPSDSKTVYASATQRYNDLNPGDPVDAAAIARFGRAESGLAKSTDGGDTWQALCGSPLRPGALAVDPDDAETVWAAAPGYGSTCLLQYGRTYGPYGQGTVARSTDGGRTWTYVYAGCTNHADACARSVCYSALIVDRTSPKNRRTLYLAGNGGGVWKSVDGGATWQTKTNGLPSSCVGALDASYGTDGTLALYAAAAFSPCPERLYPDRRKVNRAGIYRSDDGGETWRDITGNLSREIGRYRISADPRDKNVLYTAQVRGTEMPGATKGTYKTVDGGRTWKLCHTCLDKRNLKTDRWNNHYDYVGSPDTHVAIARGNPKRVAFADAGCVIWMSEDAGGTWDIVTSDRLGNFRYRTRGMDDSFILGMSVSPKNPGFLVMSCHDFDLLSSVDGGRTFFSGGQTGIVRAAGAADGTFGFMAVVHDPKDPRVAYAGSKGWSASYSEGSAFVLTTDGGRTWHGAGADGRCVKFGSVTDVFGDEALKRVAWRNGVPWRNGAPMLHNWAVRHLEVTGSGRILATKRTGVYFTDDRGASWTRAVFEGIGKDCDWAPNYVKADRVHGRVYALAVCLPLAGNGLFSSLHYQAMDLREARPDARAGLYVSDDDGAHFRKFGTLAPEMLLPTVFDVAPGGKTIYLGTAAARVRKEKGERVLPAGLWRSDDAGATWQGVATCRGRLEGCVEGIAVHPARPGRVYAAIREKTGCVGLNGLFRSDDAGATWRDVTGDAYHARYSWLSLSAADPRVLLVGTAGGGAWVGVDED